MSLAKVCCLLLLIFPFPTRLFAQDSTRVLRLPEVGWTLFIPPGTPLKNSQIDSLFEVTKGKIAPAHLDFKVLHVLFAFLDTPYNGFASAISPYDTLHLAWLTYHDSAKVQLMHLFASLRPKMVVLDTASGVENLGGRTFQRLYIKTYYPENQVTLHTYWYACPLGNYDLAINVSFSNEEVGRQYLTILRNSLFDVAKTAK